MDANLGKLESEEVNVLQMNQLVGAVVVCLLTLSGSRATAQQAPGPCGHGQTKIFGCMDTPAIRTTLSQSAPVVIQGWTLSCYTAQQPSNVDVFSVSASGERPVFQLPPSDYTIVWRGYRPDVAAYFSRHCNITSARFGYLLVIREGVLPLGNQALALQFTDPIIGVGVNHQQVSVTITP